jgi:hypothetical protein
MAVTEEDPFQGGKVHPQGRSVMGEYFYGLSGVKEKRLPVLFNTKGQAMLAPEIPLRHPVINYHTYL